MTHSILNLEVGRSAELLSIEGDSQFVERLMDMGFHPSVQIEVMGRLPLGGPLIVRVEASFLALREEEAQCLQVKI